MAMDLSTKYMGLKLKNPIVPSASPLGRDLATIKLMEEVGASAVVLESLFEEQIIHEKNEMDHFLTRGTESFAEALSYFPDKDVYNFGPEEYLEHIRKTKSVVGIPVIASDFPFIREVVLEADCGLLVQPDNVQEIARAMNHLLHNAGGAKRMGENGLRAVRERYNWQAEEKKLRSLYRALLGSDQMLEQANIADKI